MTKNAFSALVGAMCTLSLCSSGSFGQNLTGTSLSVSGTGTINTLVSGNATIGLLEVTGTADFQDNTWLFGSSGTNPGISFGYSDGTSGTNSNLSQTATRSLMSWTWQRLTASGTSTVAAMKLDASNRLTLTGTAVSNPPQIVLDPNTGMTVNGGNVLTKTAADALYIPSTTGVYVSDGNLVSVNHQYFGKGGTSYTLQNMGYVSQVIGQRPFNDGYSTQKWYINNLTHGGFEFGMDGSLGAPAFNMYATDLNGNSGKAMRIAHDQVAFFSDSGRISYIRINGDGTFYRYVGANGILEPVAPFEAYANQYGTVLVGQESWSCPGVVQLGFQGSSGYGMGMATCFVDGWPDHLGFTDQSGTEIATFSNNGEATMYGKVTVTGSNAGFVLTGTEVAVTVSSGTATKIVASGTNQQALIPEQGDLSMGDFINGVKPVPSSVAQTLSVPSESSAALRTSVNSLSNRTSATAVSGTAIISGTSLSY